MTEDNFSSILSQLQALHALYPTLRFGNLLQSAMDHDTRLSNVNLNDRSDKQIKNALEEYARHLAYKRTRE